MRGREVPARELWLLLGGFTIWAAAFALIYGLNGLGCAAGWYRIGEEPFTLQRVLLAAASVVALLAIGLLALHLRSRARALQRDGGETSSFLVVAGLYATLAALGAAAITFAPIVAISTCT